MGFAYFNLLNEGSSSVGSMIPVGKFLRWGKVVSPTVAAIDVERGLYFTMLYSYWEDDGVRSAIVIGGDGWCVEFFAVIDSVPVEAPQPAHKYTISIVGKPQKSGVKIPHAEFLCSIIVEAFPIYMMSEELIKSVDVKGWAVL